MKYILDKRLVKKKILIVCKDAGAANILSSFIKKKKIKTDFFLKGPAVEIFKKKIKRIYNKEKNNLNLKKYDFIILGTSLNDNFETNIIKQASSLGIYTICFLDHWENYLNRFKNKSKFYFPNELIVSDNYSYKIAKKIFQNKNIIINREKNYYFAEISKSKKIPKKNILTYISTNYNKYNPKIKDEKIFLDMLKKIFVFLKNQKIKDIIIQKHPSEMSNKYKSINSLVKKNFSLNIKISQKNLFSALSSSKYAIGFNTMGLAIAKLMGCKTINFLPIETQYSIPKKYIDIHIA